MNDLLQMDFINVRWIAQPLMLPFPSRVTISYIWIAHGRKMIPTACIKFGVKGSSALDIEIEIQFPGSRMLLFLPRFTIIKHMDYPCMGGRCSLSNLRSKSQSSSALVIQVEVWFPGSRMLPFPPRVTTSHIWTKCSLSNVGSKG
jgi:hypothetical protein